MTKQPESTTMLLQADSKPLAGVRVAEVAHSAAGATVGLLLAELGATVQVVPSDELVCGGCLMPRDAESMFSHGSPITAASDSEDTPFDVVVDDGPLCLLGISTLPTWIRFRTRIRITAFATPEDGSEPRRGTPFTAECAAGLAVALGDQDRSPLRLPSGVAESIAGLNATAALLALLIGDGGTLREHDIEVSLASCLEHLVGMNNKMFEGYPREWRREGRRSAGSSGPYPLAIFDATDGLVGLVGRSKRDWEAVLAAMEDPGWANNEGYRDPFEVATSHADEVDQYVGAWTRQHSIEQIMEKSHEFGFVAAPVLSLKQAMGSPQLEHRGFWRRESGERITSMNLPMRRYIRSGTTPSMDEVPAADRSAGSVRMLAEPGQLLSGIRVLDFTWVWSGPMATGILASLGAEVIKVEHPTRPDGSRVRGRPTQPDGSLRDGPEHEVTPYFHQNGAGKLSLGANLGDERAIALLRHLAENSDVVVENMRPGTLDRKALGYTDLVQDNQDLVMLSMSVAGMDGPLARTRGYATVMSGLAGYESLIGYGPGDVTGGYTFAIADPIAGLFGAIGVMAALVDRARGQGGCYLDMSQLESIMHTLRLCVGQEVSGRVATPEGVADSRLVQQHVLPVQGADAWVGVSFGTEESFQQFQKSVCAMAGITGAADGRSFWQLTESWSTVRSHEEVLRAVEASGGMAAPVVAWTDDATRRDLLGDEASVSLHHPYGGRERIFVPPWRIDGARPAFTRRAPLLGEHTSSVLAACGWDDSSDDAFHTLHCD